MRGFLLSDKDILATVQFGQAVCNWAEQRHGIYLQIGYILLDQQPRVLFTRNYKHADLHTVWLHYNGAEVDDGVGRWEGMLPHVTDVSPQLVGDAPQKQGLNIRH
jgi:hypothetical protein